MGEQAVPNLRLEDRPKIDLTDKEILDLYKFSPAITGKLLKNQARWTAYADIAEALAKSYQDYIRNVFKATK